VRQVLKIRRAIEVGHVFKLGTKYSEKLNSYSSTWRAQRKPCVMGCYGIGVTRTLQAIIEQCNDKDGIVWPLSTAPYQVCITPLAVTPDSAAMQLAEKFYAELSGAGRRGDSRRSRRTSGREVQGRRPRWLPHPHRHRRKIAGEG
jgi:prolyl-tRNA synthetase